MTRRQTTIAIVALTAIAAALRLPNLNSGLWFDEIVTLIESVRLPTLQVVTAFPGNNNHPFYSLLAHLSILAFGDHPWALRLPALVFGVAAVPLIYWLGTLVTTRLEAMLAALLMAVAYHPIWFAQNARGYTMLLAFTILCTGLVVRLLARPDPRGALAYGAAAALGIYTHLTMVFVVGAHTLVWAWSVWRASAADRASQFRTAAVALVSGGVGAGLLYLPMVVEVYRFFSGPPQKTAAVATSSWAAAEMIKGLLVGFGGIGLVAALLLLAIGGLSYLRRAPIVAALFVLPGLLTGGAMVVLHAPVRPRFFFMMAGFGLLILVRGAMVISESLSARLHVARPTLIGELSVGVVAVFSIWSLGFDYRYPKQDFESARAFIHAHSVAGDRVGTSGLAEYPYSRYYMEPWTPIATAQDFDAGRRASRLWVVYSMPEYMDRELVARLRDECQPQAAFTGTLGGGDVLVCVAGPR